MSHPCITPCHRLPLLIAALLPLALQAEPGDTYRVTPEQTNMRAGPSDESAVRTTLDGGTEVVELRSEEGWLGVRVLGTGMEGWIYGDLLQRLTRSSLQQPRPSGPFREISPEFDQLVQTLGKQNGIALFDRVERRSNRSLRVTPSRDWLLRSGRQTQVAIAVALYQTWKNFHNGAAVRMQLLDDKDQEYIGIEDSDLGPVLSVSGPAGEL